MNHGCSTLLGGVKQPYVKSFMIASSAEFAKRITYVIGPDGKIAQVHPKVDPKGHPKAILESLPG